VLERAGMDADAPTFILSECVLVYMMPEETEALLKYLASKFSTSAMVVRLK
jgi:O-methyltransferase involved in polyketide biosynthesis